MSSSTAEISQSALGLPARERAALIDKLFDSIDSEIDPARREEIERRRVADRFSDEPATESRIHSRIFVAHEAIGTAKVMRVPLFGWE